MVVESVPILGAMGVEPDAGEPSDAGAAQAADLGRERPHPWARRRGPGSRRPAARRGWQGKQKQKAHNQPPEYKPSTKKALKEAKPLPSWKAFQAYMIVQTAKLAKQGVAFETPGERMKELAARWKALSDAEKERYKSKALKLDESATRSGWPSSRV